MTTITWLHPSDLHFGSDNNEKGDRLAPDAEVVLGPLPQDVQELIQQRDLRLDFIVVTGDIAFSGKPSQYVLARNFFNGTARETVDLPKERLFSFPEITMWIESKLAQVMWQETSSTGTKKSPTLSWTAILPASS